MIVISFWGKFNVKRSFSRYGVLRNHHQIIKHRTIYLGGSSYRLPVQVTPGLIQNGGRRIILLIAVRLFITVDNNTIANDNPTNERDRLPLVTLDNSYQSWCGLYAKGSSNQSFWRLVVRKADSWFRYSFCLIQENYVKN